MTGVRRDQYGLRAYVKVGGIQRERRFPPDASLRTIQAWRDEVRVALRAVTPVRLTSGTLGADIDRYLTLVAAMPTYAQRKDHLMLWKEALGASTLRLALTTDQIRAVLQQWKTEGFAAATCNKRRTALMHLFTVLDGKDARNPVRAVPKFQAADPLPRGRDPHTIDAHLKQAVRCRSRACCRVMLWTGLRPEELQRAEPDDLDLEAGTVVVRTAKGGRARVVPLNSYAKSAWREFDHEDAWHHVPKAAPLGRWLKATTKMLSLRVYDLRHSYGTALAIRQTRLDVIGALMGHSTLELTRRYTLAAVTPDAMAATSKLGEKTASRTASFSRRKAGRSHGIVDGRKKKTA